MSKIATCLLLLTAALLLSSGSLCQAGTAGAFAKTLRGKYCSDTSGSSWYGCYAYMHYRVDLNRDKNSAKSACYKSGCGGKYGSSDPTQLPNCYKGCDKAYGADN